MTGRKESHRKELEQQDDLSRLSRIESSRKYQDASRINSNGSNFDTIIKYKKQNNTTPF